MITHVAIWFQGKIYSLPKPNRHHNVIRMIYDMTGVSVDNDKQGFLDDQGNFLDRKQAMIHALACDQLTPTPQRLQFPYLFSEDIW